jgi:hypothetical protein
MFKQKVRETALFCAILYFDWHGGLFASFNSLHHHPLPSHPHPPANSQSTKQLLSFRLQPRHDVKPPSLLLVA